MNSDLQKMIAEIEQEVSYTRHYTGRDHLDPRVIDAMTRTPRDQFVSPDMQAFAFANHPLPIGHGQTISQPYIVALMTDLLQLQPQHTVLEVGTGCGYQTAILAQLCRQVYSVEVIEALSQAATQRLQQLHYDNIETSIGNGYSGWPQHAPYDAIMVTAAATHIPSALIQQLKAGGRMVIPVGQPHGSQQLILVEKNDQGEAVTRPILDVAFVPLQEPTDNEDNHEM